MKRGLILAVSVVLAAAIAGCAFQGAIPAFLLPAGQAGEGTPAPQETAAASAAPSPETATPSPTGTPAATPSETPAPTSEPTQPPQAQPDPEPYPVLKTFDSAVPDGLAVDLEYAKYVTPMNYFVALKSGSVYAEPDAKSKKLKSFSFASRFRLDKLVQGPDGKSKWYHVMWTVGNDVSGGYVKESAGSGRSFRLDMMLERAKALKASADQDSTVYIVNYKNRNGTPPALPGSPVFDPHGYRRDQSAPAYAEPDTASAFRYAPDGMLGRRLEKANGMTKVFFPSFNEARWVPDKYLSKDADAIGSLNQVVVVDRLYQNTASFEYRDGTWTLISMSYVSTGKDGGYALKTPLGDFMAQERVSKFYYYKDGTKTIEGYAPYAVRFSGGGYLHGVPRKFRFDEAGNRIDPGPAESLSTLGTTPQSHMCVRNYTSYAKFTYDWFKKGQTAIIVIE